MNFKWLSAGALVVAALGIYLQIVSGNVPGYPAIAPGVIVLLVAAALTAFVPFRWSPIAAILASAFMIIGLFANNEESRLINVVTVGDTTGLWLQMIAVVVSAITAVVAISRPPAKSGARTPTT